MTSTNHTTERQRLKEVAAAFLRLGCTAFGGPVAHIAMMRSEFVDKHRWLTAQEFVDLLGLTQLIPGPNSTEMAMHIGYLRAGRAGLVVAGFLFILPAALMVTAIAALYSRLGSTPTAQAALHGAKPIILAIIAQALFGLRKQAIPKWPLAALAGAVAVLALKNVPELPLIFVPACLAGVYRWLRVRDRAGGLLLVGATICVIALFGLSIYLATVRGATSNYSPAGLAVVFLKVGAVLYGSGYVLVAYLNTDLVERLQWLSHDQLLDAVTVGQFTPGPVFTTATFIGYVLGGLPGALVATVCIFLPSFVLVGLTVKATPWLRGSSVTGGFVDVVNAASFGVMAAVLWRLGREAALDPVGIATGIIALVILVRTKFNSAWLVLGGAAIGVFIYRAS